MFDKGPNIDIKRDCYIMATVEGDTAEITMYGEIVEQQPVDCGPVNQSKDSTSSKANFLKI